MNFAVVIGLFLPLVEAKYRNSVPIHQGFSSHEEQGKPTSRHKNHCAYVIEKTVSFTVQDGAAPYVKAEYNKCSWAKKCPTLMYRLLYKPMFRVAHKTVTELEWRCCPGYSGYNCMEVQPTYQHPMRMMPPFKGPSMKGPQFREPQYQGPMLKGPMFKAPPVNPAVNPVNTWSHLKKPLTNRFSSYPLPQFGPPKSSSYPDTSFEPYPAEPLPAPEYQQPHLTDGEHEREGEYNQRPEDVSPAEMPTPPSGEEQKEGKITGQALDSETEERIFRIEEDLRHLNHVLETLRGTVSGLESSLRASLREDANRMLSALLSAAPSPLAAPATASNPPTIGFVEIPARDLDMGLDGSHVFPGLTELSGGVEELRTELYSKVAELQELRATVQGHDGVLKMISKSAAVPPHSSGNAGGSIESLIDAKLSAARVEILDGLEKRVESAEERCKEKAGDERRQCQKDHHQRQEQMRDALEESTSKLRTELGNVQSQIHGLTNTKSCCGSMSGLSERVQRLETSMTSLNRSHGHLRVDLSGHKDHIEGMLEGRLRYVEAKVDLIGQNKSDDPVPEDAVTGRSLEARMEGKLRDLEDRLLTALEELSNATAPALLEGHAVPTLETELESIRGRLELDVDRVQKRLNNLELLCSNSYSLPHKSATQKDSAGPGENQELEQNMKQVLDLQTDRLTSLNFTLQKILNTMALRERQADTERFPPIQAELTVLKFNVRSVNHTLMSLQDSVGTVAHQVGEANSSWHEREVRLAKQIKGVVQLVGHQASMLGAGERRLTRLKGELQEMKRRLAEEVRGCRSTAMVVKKEVTEVGGRVASVEDQCKGLSYLAEDLERIREELEKQSNSLILQVNGTLSSHAQQLYELKDELRNCSMRAEPTKSSEMTAQVKRGDTFNLN